MKKIRTLFNIFLGMLIGLLLPACKVHKQKTKPTDETPQQPAIEKVSPDDRIKCLYGVPSVLYRQQTDSVQ